MSVTAIEIRTPGRALVEVTDEVRRLVRTSGVREGLCCLFLRHTSASLVIHENADPSATSDLLAFFERLVPDGDPAYAHTAEGPDDMPAHLRTVLTRSAEVVPITDGELALGRWQGLFVFEHRRSPQRRRLLIQILAAAPETTP